MTTHIFLGILRPLSPNRVVKSEQTTLHSKGTNCPKHMVSQKHHVTHTTGGSEGAGQQTVPNRAPAEERVTNTLAEKPAGQFLCGKETMSYAKICPFA